MKSARLEADAAMVWGRLCLTVPSTVFVGDGSELSSFFSSSLPTRRSGPTARTGAETTAGRPSVGGPPLVLRAAAQSVFRRPHVTCCAPGGVQMRRSCGPPTVDVAPTHSHAGLR